MIAQAHWYLGESLDIHFSPDLLTFTLEARTRIGHIAIFEQKISI